MKQKEIVLLLGSVLFIVIAWIGFSVYHSSVSTTIPLSSTKETEPIKSNFDEATIRKVNERNQVPPTYQFDVAPIEIQETPTVTPTSAPVSTSSSSLSQEDQNQTSTTGGQLIP